MQLNQKQLFTENLINFNIIHLFPVLVSEVYCYYVIILFFIFFNLWKYEVRFPVCSQLDFSKLK